MYLSLATDFLSSDTLLTETSKLRCLSTELRLKRKTAADRLLGLRVRIPPGAWMCVCCECRVLSVRRANHSSRGVLPSVVCLECHREASIVRKPWPTKGCCAQGGGGIYRNPHAIGIVTVDFGRLL